MRLVVHLDGPGRKVARLQCLQGRTTFQVHIRNLEYSWNHILRQFSRSAIQVAGVPECRRRPTQAQWTITVSGTAELSISRHHQQLSTKSELTNLLACSAGLTNQCWQIDFGAWRCVCLEQRTSTIGCYLSSQAKSLFTTTAHNCPWYDKSIGALCTTIAPILHEVASL